MKKGFTLVELLIVIAILGVLAAILLIAINPVQQLARARDTGRKQAASQLGRANEAYAVNNSGVYVPETAGAWVTNLVTAGEVSVAPSAITYSVTGISACTAAAGSVQNGFCYDATTAAGGGPMIVYTRLEATTDISKCTAQYAGTNQAYAIYSSGIGKGGIVCMTTAEPTVGGNGNGQNWLP